MLVDIHTHVLPNIDDGARDLEESLKMLEVYSANNINTVITTPHFDFSIDNLEEFLKIREDSYNQVEALIKQNQLNVDLLLGVEIMYSPNLDQYNLEKLTLNNTDYLLIELPVFSNPISLKHTLSKIISQGYIIILAHVERYSYLINNGKLMQELINMGVLFQVNTSFAISDSKRNLFNAMNKYNLIHFIASDAHDCDRRIPNLHSTLEAIENRFDIDILKGRNNNLVNNELIDVVKPGYLKKLFNWYYWNSKLLVYNYLLNKLIDQMNEKYLVLKVRLRSIIAFNKRCK